MLLVGFWISIVSRIPDSRSFIPDSKAHDFIFHKKKFCRISESVFPYIGGGEGGGGWRGGGDEGEICMGIGNSGKRFKKINSRNFCSWAIVV